MQSIERNARLSRLQSLYGLIGADTQRHTEHIGKAGGFVRFSRIVAVHGLVNVTLKVCLGDKVISAEDAALEMRPKTFDGVGGHIALGVFLHTVTDDAVNVALAREAVVCGEFVREHLRVVGHELPDNRHKCLGLRVLDLHCADGTLALHHSEDRSLGLHTAALVALSALAFVLVRLASAEVHLVHFNLALKGRRVVLCVECADLVENEPRGLLRHMNVAAKLMGGYSLLVRRDKVHSHKPLDEGNLSVLKDSPNGFREVVIASGAHESTIFPAVTMAMTAVRTNHITVRPTGLCDGCLAFGRSVKVKGDFHEGVEVAEVNHSAFPYVLQILIPLKHRNLTLKVQYFHYL